MARFSVTKTVSQNGDATDPTLVGPPFNLVSVSVTGSFTAIIALQRSFDQGSSWETVESYTAPIAKNMEVAETQYVQLICTSYNAGTPQLRLGY